MIKVKICGITNPQDAVWATGFGADFLGFNFVKGSGRRVSLSMAKKIIQELPTFVACVGIFSDDSPEDVLRAVRRCGLRAVQLHGSETPQYCALVKQELTQIRPDCRIIKAHRKGPHNSFDEILNYDTDYWLFDTYSDEEIGGSGIAGDWELLKNWLAAQSSVRPFFIAGGLDADNVSEAIAVLNPFGVDVASGVERLPRRKDYEKLKRFICGAKEKPL